MSVARRIGLGLVVLALAAGGITASVLFFTSRDSSSVDAGNAGPGQEFADQGHAHLRPGATPSRPYASDPPTSGAHVPKPIAADGRELDADQLLQAIELGDVVILYPGAGAPPAALRKLQSDESGPFDRALADSGQAVVLARYQGVKAITAVAWRHLLRVNGASDPKLRAFVQYWLDHGGAG